MRRLTLIAIPYLWLSDPGLCLDGVAEPRGLAQSVTALAGGDKRAFDDPEHPNGGLYRYRLYLSTIYGFAHLFNIGKA